MKPYYEDELVTLYHGKCLETLAKVADCQCGHPREEHGAGMDSKCLSYINALSVPAQVCACPIYRPGPTAHVVVTSPPYNMGLVPGGNGRGMYRPGASTKGGRFREGYSEADDDALPQDEYDTLRREELELFWEVIPDDGAIYWNHRQRVEHGTVRLPLGMDFGPLNLRQIVTWDRGTGIGPSKRHYCSVGEWIFLFAKPDFSLVSHSASGFGDVWRMGMSKDDQGHPAPFPLALPSRAISDTGARSVLDPFAGTGTTLLAATMAGIPSIGIERSERWCETIAKRLDQGVLDFGEPA